MSLKSRFKKWQDTHPNPLTPEITRLERADNKIIELSKSRHKEFYGVAVWQKLNEDCSTCNEDRPPHWRFETVSHELAQSFHDRDEAVHYQNVLKNKLKNHAEIEDIIQEGIK